LTDRAIATVQHLTENFLWIGYCQSCPKEKPPVGGAGGLGVHTRFGQTRT